MDHGNCHGRQRAKSAALADVTGEKMDSQWTPCQVEVDPPIHLILIGTGWSIFKGSAQWRTTRSGEGEVEKDEISKNARDLFRWRAGDNYFIFPNVSSEFCWATEAGEHQFCSDLYRREAR